MENAPTQKNEASRHRVYGLTVDSWIPFPELPEAPPRAEVNIVFRRGQVPGELEAFCQTSKCYQAAIGRLLVRYEGIARYLVTGGREIVVEPAEGVLESDVRLYLLCSPMGALLLQRGLLPLHASAISTPRGAVLFMGKSGAGKSTLAAEYRRRGFRVLTDDISVISFSEEGFPWVSPGFPQFKLRPDVIDALGERSDNLPRSSPNFDKATMAFPDEFESTPMPVACIYLVQPSAGVEAEIQSVGPLVRISDLVEHTYRLNFVKGLGLQQSHFRQVARLAARVRLTRVIRPHDKFRIEKLADLITGDFDQ